MASLKDMTGVSDSDTDNNGGGGTGGINLGPGSGSGFPLSAGSLSSVDLLEMLIDYNAKFKNAAPILFRYMPMTQMLATLIGKDKPNCLLIGQAGVGKTKLVEELARLLANNDPLIPDQLKKHKIYELPISKIISGSSFVGQLEEKTKAILDFVKDKKNKVILYIDEIHQLCDSRSHVMDNIAQILKPALARGEIKCIGSTTLQESTKLYSQPAFNRRFSKVVVEELTQTQTAEILKKILPAYLKHHNYKFSNAENVLEAIPAIADQFVSGNHRPDNAITLMDRAVSNLIMGRQAKIASLQTLADNTADPQEAANAQAALQALNQNPVIPVSAHQVKTQAINLMKGGAIKETTDFDELRQRLEVIKGQDKIIDEIITLLRREEKNLFPRKKPLTVLFAGPSGVGKTEITKIIANHMTGKDPIILNMTEYIHSTSVNQIIGSNTGYVGSDSNIELPFDCLESNPYQFIMLDEFEKGSKAVQRLFMRVFDEGKLKTNRQQELDFSKAIIIATTNAGHSETRSLGFSTTQIKTRSSKNLAADLKNWFDTELLNRFEYIKPFNVLSPDTYIDIINNVYTREIERIRQSSRVKLLDVIDDETLVKFRSEYNQDFGARPVFNLVKEYIENQI